MTPLTTPAQIFRAGIDLLSRNKAQALQFAAVYFVLGLYIAWNASPDQASAPAIAMLVASVLQLFVMCYFILVCHSVILGEAAGVPASSLRDRRRLIRVVLRELGIGLVAGVLMLVALVPVVLVLGEGIFADEANVLLLGLVFVVAYFISLTLLGPRIPHIVAAPDRAEAPASLTIGARFREILWPMLLGPGALTILWALAATLIGDPEPFGLDALEVVKLVIQTAAVCLSTAMISLILSDAFLRHAMVEEAA
ncbi:hypothetical protein KHP62_18810 [Rhodobacteraceae bacterium NNCM2]|nr:hypothetical protein [Coraliihabitans acroporae]